MKFQPSGISGAIVVDLEPKCDERGFFERFFCEKEFLARGLETRFVQCNLSFNYRKGTLRGLHYQTAPYGEVKLVGCVRGRIYDVVVDLRKNSPSYKRWVGVELTEENHRLLYVPSGCAHGYLTLTDHATVFYMVSEFYHPEAERGVRWNDPAFEIRWPMQPALMSAKDQAFLDWAD